MTIEEFRNLAGECVAAFDAFAQRHSLADIARADHICYKCGSKESFENLRAMLENESAYIYQSIISKRRIAIIKFKEGIESLLGTINFLELSDQKPDNSQKDGFDHIEAYPVGITYDDMVAKLEASETVIKVERPHHTTHDIELPGGFIFRCTQESLIEKIKREEMV